MRRAHVALFASLTLGVSALTACGSDSLEGSDSGGGGETTSAAEVEVDDAVAELVPEDIKSKGTLNIGSDASYAPNEFLGDDGKTVEGMDVELFDAAAAKMGLKTKWSNASFDSLILGVSSDKYDVAVSSFTINDERKKQVNMISYFDAGTQWVTAKGNPGKVDPKDPCGATVGVQKGTVQFDELEELNKKCDDKIKIVVEQEQSKVTASLVSGKTEAMAADSPIKTLDDLIARFKADPGSVSWGGFALGSPDHILCGSIVKAIGGDVTKMNYIVSGAGGEMLAQVMGGHLTVATGGLNEFAQQIQAGTLRALAISSPERLPGVDIPTLKEQGVDVELVNWRGLVAPGKVRPDDLEALDTAMAEMARSAEWRTILQERGWVDMYQPADAFAAFLATERSRIEGILKETGLIQ